MIKPQNHRIGDKHVANAKLIANRQSMLNLLPKNCVVGEIGVDNGDYSEKILETCTPIKLELIDLWGTNRYNNDKFLNVSNKFAEQINNEEISITRMKSTEAADCFEDNYFDWIYLDTDHSYQTTIQELYAYEDKVKKKGYIAGHDYAMGNWNKQYKYGVIEAVAEFCVEENWRFVYLTADYVENPSFVITRI